MEQPLDKKAMVNLKIYTSQTGQEIITIHILRKKKSQKSKGDQTMKFGQLIDYNMRNFFLQKL